jgi:predicted metal-dependent hydrolase
MQTISTAIRVRAMDFDVARGSGGLWNPRLPEVSHTLNAFQLALPYLEPYFIEAVKEGVRRVDDPRLQADVRAFCAQEANHARQHTRYNRVLKARYPRLEDFEAQIHQHLLRQRREAPLAWRLAFTAACEAITGELARFLLSNASAWFRDADTHFAALMVWHAVEEIEHKCVAFEVLRTAAVPARVRVRALMAAIQQMLLDLDPVATYMLRVDGIRGARSTTRRWAFRADFLRAVLPRILGYALPGYDPSREPDPAAAREWIAAYARGEPLDVLRGTAQAQEFYAHWAKTFA